MFPSMSSFLIYQRFFSLPIPFPFPFLFPFFPSQSISSSPLLLSPFSSLLSSIQQPLLKAPTARRQFVGWISDNLDAVDERASLAGLIGCGVVCLQDRNQDVRHASEVCECLVCVCVFCFCFRSPPFALLKKPPNFFFPAHVHKNYEKRRPRCFRSRSQQILQQRHQTQPPSPLEET